MTIKRTLQALTVAVSCCAGASAHAASAVSILNNGASANRIDMVILGDGYTSAQLPKFQTDAQNFVAKFFAEEPFKSYQKFFNVWRIDVASTTSGASHTGSPGTTAYGAYFKCFSIERLLCVVQSKVDSVLTAANMTGVKKDMVLVIVNDPEYGGSGGTIAVASTEANSSEIAIHEFGHSFGRLDDEYVDLPNCGRYTTPIGGFNVTKETMRATIPWHVWIAAGTPIPTTTMTNGLVGLYQGGFYCNTWYRPTYNSKMNMLGQPFYQVNSEQLVRRIYESTSPLDAVSPTAASVTIAPAASKTFIAKATDPALVKYTWRLNGVVKASGAAAKSLAVKGDSFGATGKLQVVVQDRSGKVKNDPNHVTTEVHSWTLKRGS